MALIAHTFRIEQHTLDEVERMGDGNASLGVRIALDKARSQSLKTFAFGVLAGLASSVIVHLTLLLLLAE